MSGAAMAGPGPRPTDDAFTTLTPFERVHGIWRYNDERYGKENVGGPDVDEDTPFAEDLAELQEYADRLAHHQRAAHDPLLTLAQRGGNLRTAGRLARRWPAREINGMYRFEGTGMLNEEMSPALIRQRDALVDGLRGVRSRAVTTGRTGRGDPLAPRRIPRAPDVTPGDNALNVTRGRTAARQRRAAPVRKGRTKATGKGGKKATVKGKATATAKGKGKGKETRAARGREPKSRPGARFI